MFSNPSMFLCLLENSPTSGTFRPRGPSILWGHMDIPVTQYSTRPSHHVNMCMHVFVYIDIYMYTYMYFCVLTGVSHFGPCLKQADVKRDPPRQSCISRLKKKKRKMRRAKLENQPGTNHGPGKEIVSKTQRTKAGNGRDALSELVL